jgi:lactoylglutathione lyase
LACIDFTLEIARLENVLFNKQEIYLCPPILKKRGESGFEKMKIEHLAIWTNDLEGMRRFYETCFRAKSGELYVNPKKNFRSYFLRFGEGCRLELMHQPGMPPKSAEAETTGIAHFALSVGSEEKVNEITEKLRREGHSIAGEPRWTGDGYYESIVLDPEGNRIEITI